ncbi:MAG: FliH/SctL family protein [Bacteriovoracia bacterium]
MSNSEKKSFSGVKLSDVKVVDLNKGKEASALPGSSINGHNIVTVAVQTVRNIDEFSPSTLKDTKGIHYGQIKKGFDHSTKNSRFRISELTRGPLSVDEEEEQRIVSEVESRLNKKLDELRKEVSDQAQLDGLEEGKKIAREEVFAEAKPDLERLQGLIKQFESMSKDVFKANEEFLIRLVYRIAKLVILKEISEDKDYIKRLVENILERLGTKENIKVFVSPKEYSTVQNLKHDLAQTLGELKNITIEVDSQIESAGCRLETDFGEVDARIEVQIDSIAKAFGANS